MLGSRGPDLGRTLDRVLAGQARIERCCSGSRARRRAAAGPARAEPGAGAAPSRGRTRPPPRRATPEPAAAAESEPARPAWATLVRALDFPRDAEDREGFRALRAALRHPGLAQMLQAAEDVLNLLSQEGVYVDELPMDPVDPAAWRRFIAGTRGPRWRRSAASATCGRSS